MRERDIEKYLIRRVKEVGGKVRKLSYIGRRACVDRLVLLPGRHIFIELKHPGKHATPAQGREHNVLRWAGCDTYVISSVEAIERILR